MPKIPDFCSSLHCGSLGCDYCKECSHAFWLGEGMDHKGKVWKWEFNRYYGPTFLRRDGEPLARQPVSETHPAWEAFETWNMEVC